MSERTTSHTRTRRRVLTVLAAVAVAAIAVGLWAFQPWKLLTSSTLNEAPPAVTVANTGPSATAAPPAQPFVLAEGAFLSQEHQTSGIAKVLTLPDGSRVLRLESLASSDGPDLHVWLTDQQAGGDWRKYDDGHYLPLGKLKATHGNQNYPIPADADLTGLRSVVIWCDRFNVAFGSAPLPL